MSQYFLVFSFFTFMTTISQSSIDKRGKFSRKRLNEDEGDITYINERNRVFNKKVGEFIDLLTNLSLIMIIQIARYYDKYTAEIRASFERGTAL
jgi:pre-mRNA-splicing factor SYF2